MNVESKHVELFGLILLFIRKRKHISRGNNGLYVHKLQNTARKMNFNMASQRRASAWPWVAKNGLGWPQMAEAGHGWSRLARGGQGWHWVAKADPGWPRPAPHNSYTLHRSTIVTRHSPKQKLGIKTLFTPFNYRYQIHTSLTHCYY